MLITCLTIFLARLIDVTIGTISTINLVKGRKYIAAILSFFEVFIWFIAVKKALNTSIKSIMIPFSYAAGYASGTILGSFISEKWINDTVSIQAIIKESYEHKLINEIKNKGYKVSVIELNDKYSKSRQNMLFIETKKQNINQLTLIIKKIDKNALITINEIKYIKNNINM